MHCAARRHGKQYHARLGHSVNNHLFTRGRHVEGGPSPRAASQCASNRIKQLLVINSLNNLYPVSASTPVVNNLLLSKRELAAHSHRPCGGGPVPQGQLQDEGAGASGDAAQRRLSWLTTAAQMPEASHAFSGVAVD
jgi:hypothetical protein